MSIGNVIDKGYFNYLSELVYAKENGYSELCKKLHSISFSWFIPNDDNRIADAMELRKDYIKDIHYDKRAITEIVGECTMLELLIAVARRCYDITSYDNEDLTYQWFYILLKNTGLSNFDDKHYVFCPEKDQISDICKTIIDRDYDRKGHGGLFPLKKTKKDQRDIEIWYQMQEWLLENYFDY